MRLPCPPVNETMVTVSVRILAGHRVLLRWFKSKINEVPVYRAVGRVSTAKDAEVPRAQPQWEPLPHT